MRIIIIIAQEPNPRSPSKSEKGNSTLCYRQSYPSSSIQFHDPSSTSRHEILQSKLKEYRESTYWGEETSTYEIVKHMSDYEFDCFINEVKENDADVYWDAEF